MVKIKICGLKSGEDIRIANKYRPDYVGFVFAKSRRQVTAAQAAVLRQELHTEIPVAGVFVNDSIEMIEMLCKEKTIQVVQLHGDENEEYINKLRGKIGQMPIIKAVRVQSAEQILENEKLPCDYLLLDTYTKEMYGGSGKVFDKAMIPTLSKPYFIAGGLDVENVENHIKKCNPYAVDVSSAVETDGIKDDRKIKMFIERIRKQ